jgi:hypothetical protein
MRQANFLFHMAFHIQKRKLACHTLYLKTEAESSLRNVVSYIKGRKIDNIQNYDSYIVTEIFITTFNGNSCSNYRNETCGYCKWHATHFVRKMLKLSTIVQRETWNRSRSRVEACSAVRCISRRSRHFVPLFIYSRKPFQIAEWDYFLLRK